MKLTDIITLVRLLPKSIYFNFHYLSFSQARKLPVIFLSNIKLGAMKGSISFSSPIHSGMVRFGGGNNALYPTTQKCGWSNFGGKVIFGNKVYLSKGSALEIGLNAKLVIGNNVYIGVQNKIACYESVSIGDNTETSWEIVLTDTDFHSLVERDSGNRTQMTRPVKIGKNNWIGIRTIILKGTKTPDFCTASAGSMLNKHYDIPSYSIIGNPTAHLKKEGYYLDVKTHVNNIQYKKLNRLHSL